MRSKETEKVALPGKIFGLGKGEALKKKRNISTRRMIPDKMARTCTEKRRA